MPDAGYWMLDEDSSRLKGREAWMLESLDAGKLGSLDAWMLDTKLA